MLVGLLGCVEMPGWTREALTWPICVSLMDRNNSWRRAKTAALILGLCVRLPRKVGSAALNYILQADLRYSFYTRQPGAEESALLKAASEAAVGAQVLL